MNLWVENYLKEFVNTHYNDWSTFLPVAEFTHNSWNYEHTRHTSYKLIMGINPTASINTPENIVPMAHNQLKELQMMRVKAQLSLQRHIKTINPPCTFALGDKVWLDTVHATSTSEHPLKS